MKHSCRNFSFIAAVLGLLTIFPHQSEAAAAYDAQGPRARLLHGRHLYITSCEGGCNDGWQRARQLVTGYLLPPSYVSISQGPVSVTRGLETTGEEEEDATPSNLFHINLQELSSLLDCQEGCTAAFALIPSDQCNTTDALNSALKYKLEEEITFDPTHMKKDEDAPDYGWATKPFRELASKSTDNTTASTTPPITLAEFVAAAAMVSELIDTMTPNQDYNLAVYLYNNETDPLACTTLELVTEDEELQEYYALFGGGDGGEDGSDVVEGGEKPVAAVGNASSLLSGGLLAYAVAGVSVMLSAILFA